jgi:hypothetical protein
MNKMNKIKPVCKLLNANKTSMITVKPDVLWRTILPYGNTQCNADSQIYRVNCNTF